MDRDSPTDGPVRYGTVFVAYREPDGQRPGWYAYWDAVEVDTGAEPALLADGGWFATAGEAGAWGISRSPRVVVQDGAGRHYWAGDAPMPDDPELTGRWEPDGR